MRPVGDRPVVVHAEPASLLIPGIEKLFEFAGKIGDVIRAHGRHVLSALDQQFFYQPFKLKTKIPATINRGDLAFDFLGLASEDYIRVILTDTSFMSKDIHEIDTVKNNRLIITADKLKNLTDGPITLQFYKEIEKPIRNGTKEGGRISISYGLQREFELRSPQTP